MLESRPPRSGRRRWIAWIIPLLMLGSLGAWGLSSPVGASPDDDFHLASIWCAVGEKPDACASTEDPSERIVPQDLLDATCYAFHSDVSARCQGSDYGTDSSDVGTTARGNFDGLYPPVYYFVVSSLVGRNIEVSVLAIRLLNATVFVLFLGAVSLLLPSHRRRTLIGAIVISVVPLGMFIIPSINPSSWAILSAATLRLSLLGYFESAGVRKLLLGVASVLATIIGAGARADAAAYAGVAISAVVIMTIQRRRSYLLEAILPLALGVVAVIFFLSAGQSSASSEGLSGYGSDLSPRELFLRDLLEVPSLFVGVFGQWPLGWFDTPLPAAVWVSATACFCGVLFANLGRGSAHRAGVGTTRKTIALLAVLSTLWLFPTILLVRSDATVGSAVQPRYILPLIVILAGIALLREPGFEFRPSLLQVAIFIGALSLANSIALFVNIRRYVTGTDVGGLNLDAAVEWWWSIPISPMGVWILGTICFTAALLLLGTTVITGRDRGVLTSEESLSPLRQDATK